MRLNGPVFDDFMRKLTPGAVIAGSSLPPVIGVRAAEEKPSRETDLYAWLLDQANELRSRRPDFIDWSELAEELDEIVALARTEVVSRLRTLLAHLLKWKYQTERRDERSWKTTVVNQRLDLSLLLESKNLRNFLAQKGYAKAYEQAREAAGDQMQLERHVWQSLFPEACEWDSETALNNEFFPSPPASDSNGHSR
jgi:hypothetical protein